MHELIEAIRQTFDSKINAWILAAWGYITVKFGLSDFAIFSSVCLTWVMIARQSVALRKDLSGGGKSDADT